MAAGRRFKFNGSTFEIQTGLATPLVVTDISNAEPAEVSATNTLELGAVVKITDAMVGLNGNLYPIDNPDAGGFELAGSNSVAYPEFALDSPNLARATPVTFSPFCELTSVNNQGGSADEIEVTTICSTAKEFEVGLSDTGTLQLDFNLAPNEAVQAALRASQVAGTALAYRITFPEDGGTMILTGFVQQFGFQGAVNGVWTASATIKLTGELFVLPAAA